MSEVLAISAIVFAIISLLVSLAVATVVIGWKNSTHKVYTKFVQADGKPLDMNKQMEEYTKELELDEL